MRVEIDTKDRCQSIRIGFTDQRLTAHGGMVVWSRFLQQKKFRAQMQRLLPHAPTSPNAYAPDDTVLGYMGGILCGADKLSRVSWLQSDPAVAEVLGVEAGYTRQGIKPCHRPLIAALAEAKLVANYWLRSGNTSCVNGAAEFLRTTVAGLPSQVRLGLVRADSGFGHESFMGAAGELGLNYIVVARLTQPIQSLCRHQDEHWEKTGIPGLEVQEADTDRIGRRLILIRQRIAERPQSGGKSLLDLPAYRFQALWTNLKGGVPAVQVWRRYSGRADVENRIRELGDQFGIKRLAVKSFWGTEAMHHLAIASYNLCVLLQRRLGQLEKCELNTLRWRLFSRAAVWSKKGGKPTLKLAVRGKENQTWWRQILEKLLAPPNCNSVESLQA